VRNYKQLLLANRAWALELVEEKSDFFERQAHGQKPEFLWIGCSDSRVSPEQMTMSPPGGMFLHRNIANLVTDDDLNLMSVLQYGVEVLGVKHLIVCGHYGCGGVKAAVQGGTSGFVDTWLQTARNVASDHWEELGKQATPEAKINRLVEFNVRDQLVNLARTAIVQKAFGQKQDLWLHGWVYDIRDGRIKPLMEIDRDTTLETVPHPRHVLLTADESNAAPDIGDY
jgi:carbonic anhydrase